jgi:hypothetical protein
MQATQPYYARELQNMPSHGHQLLDPGHSHNMQQAYQHHQQLAQQALQASICNNDLNAQKNVNDYNWLTAIKSCF